MARTCVLLSLVLVLTLPLVAQTAATTELTAEQIVAKNVAARGGLAAWRAVQSMTMSGRMDAGKGVQLPYRLELKRPRKMRLELEFKNETAVQVYDGASGWKLRPFAGRKEAEPLSLEEMQAAAAQSDLDGHLIDYAAKGLKVELLGQEAVDGRAAYKLKVTGSNTPSRHVWVDAETLLDVKVDGSRRVRGKEQRVETYYSEYKRVGALLLPHVLETTVSGVPGRHKLVIERVQLNPVLANSRFAKP